jgi:hypothetical protein
MLSDEEYLRFLKTQEKNITEKIKKDPFYCNREGIVLVRFEIYKMERRIKNEQEAFKNYINTQLDSYYSDNGSSTW